MFKLEVDPVFSADVDIPVPGKPPERVNFQFKHLSDDEFEAMAKSLRDEVRTIKELVRDIVVGWKAPGVEFDKDALDTCFKLFPGSPLAIFMAYRVALFEGRRKN